MNTRIEQLAAFFGPMTKAEAEAGEVLEIPEVGTVLETPFGIYADEMGVLRG